MLRATLSNSCIGLSAIALFVACSETTSAPPSRALPLQAASAAFSGPVEQDSAAASRKEGCQTLTLDGGFLPATVFVPAADGPWPLVVATHGAGGAPEWECEYWRRLTQGRFFIACLRGEPIDRRATGSYYYKNHLELGREFRALNDALGREYSGRLDSGFALYAGFSQGAIMGAPMIVAHAARFRRLALIEGGYEYWSVSTARAFARNGGERVLFACGTRWCAQKAELPASWLRQAKVDVRIEYAEGAGHTPTGEVMSKVQASLPWLLGR